MAVYFVTGKLRSGKTLAMVGRIRDYLLAGRKVATNLDLNLDKLLAPHRTCTVTRLSDVPTADELAGLGQGNDGPYDESKFGALIFDECGRWLNTREWNKPGRRELYDWLIHAGKLQWDVYLLVHDLEVIDKQIRDSFCEHLVICERLDRQSISLSKFTVIGAGLLIGFGSLFGFVNALILAVCCAVIFGLLGTKIPLPKVHIAKVYYGDNVASPRVDTWMYRGTDLYGCYDTQQKFLDRDNPNATGLHVMLSPFHLVGRYQKLASPMVRKVRLWVLRSVFGGVLLVAFAGVAYSVGAGDGWLANGLNATRPELSDFVPSASSPVSPEGQGAVPELLQGIRISGSMVFSDGSVQLFLERHNAPFSLRDLPGARLKVHHNCAATLRLAEHRTELRCEYASHAGGPAGGLGGLAQPSPQTTDHPPLFEQPEASNTARASL